MKISSLIVAATCASNLTSAQRVSIPLHNEPSQFYGTLQVGGNCAQSFPVMFDTGSSEIWLPGPGCENCDTDHKAFHPDQSPSFSGFLSGEEEGGYASGQVQYRMGRDLICMDARKVADTTGSTKTGPRNKASFVSEGNTSAMMAASSRLDGEDFAALASQVSGNEFNNPSLSFMQDTVDRADFTTARHAYRAFRDELEAATERKVIDACGTAHSEKIESFLAEHGVQEAESFSQAHPGKIIFPVTLGFTDAESFVFKTVPFDGIVGMAPTGSKLVDALHKAGKIGDRVFSINLKFGEEKMTFGGPGAGVAEHDIAWYQNVGTEYWMVDNVKVSGFDASDKFRIVLDSGSDSAMFNDVQQMWLKNPDSGCEKQLKLEFPDKKFTGHVNVRDDASAAARSTAMQDLLHKWAAEQGTEFTQLSSTASQNCDNLSVMSLGGFAPDVFVLGKDFFHDHEVVFDLDKNRVGFVTMGENSKISFLKEGGNFGVNQPGVSAGTEFWAGNVFPNYV